MEWYYWFQCVNDPVLDSDHFHLEYQQQNLFKL